MARNDMYRLNGIAHVAGYIDEEPTRCVRTIRRQQKMILHDRIMPYLDSAGLLHVARLNDYWFKLDEPLISAFVERWRPETHTFHMPFGECTVGSALSLYRMWHISSASLLMDFQFRDMPNDATEPTVQVYARGYIMMLLSTMLFGDKSGARVHLRWLPYVADLDGLGKYSWGSATLSWLYRCLCRVANRNVKNLAGPLSLLQFWIFWRFPTFRPRGFDVILWPLASRWGRYMPSSDEKGPRVIATRHRLDRLRVDDVSIISQNAI
ncbi:serine/threonine-protein phosphatase 7 long form homolog [Arachis duranensis]|uniref:Serine/threonine-protein phosphatase 7 long form homolog n=1 Tax=Arachis duranensis TaxID=130453 RepID=A0A6P5N835_ARADU|nr:serine/threonine-protein phosphatase 7 long form homolog [Arachis duranensis]